MRFLLGILVLLAAPWPSEAGESNKACEPQLLAEVVLHVSPDGTVYMPVSLGAQEVFFQLSIGSGLPSLAESAVRTLGLKAQVRRGGSELSVGGTPITHFAMLEEMKIGNFKLLRRAAPIIPQPGVDSPEMVEGKPVAGTMGSGLLRNVDAELHLAERQFKLFKPFRCLSRSPVYWGGEAAELPLRFDPAGTLVFALDLDGRKVESSLLAGGGVSSIDVNAAREFFGFDATSDGAQSQFHAMSLTGPGIGIKDAKVRLRANGGCKLSGSTPVWRAIGYSDCINLVPFSLGSDLLAQMRIYISRERQKVYVSAIGTLAAK